MVTHPSTNGARRALTSFMRRTPLTTTPRVCLLVTNVSCAKTYEPPLGLWSCRLVAPKNHALSAARIHHGRGKKGKGSPYSITERKVPELIPVLCSQSAGDVSHKPGDRLPLLSARPAVTLATLKRAAARGTIGVNSLLKTVTRQRRGCDLNPGPSAPESSTLTTLLTMVKTQGQLCANAQQIEHA